jgi:hypothetical protein
MDVDSQALEHQTGRRKRILLNAELKIKQAKLKIEIPKKRKDLSLEYLLSVSPN